MLWPPDVKNWLIGKDPDAGKDWRREEKGVTEDKTVRWHHWLNGHEFEQAPGVGEGQGNLACCSPWGCKVRHDWTTELNWTAAESDLNGSELTVYPHWPGFFSFPLSFYLKNLFIFNWRIIALQSHVGFCHTTTWISHRYTYVPCLLNLLPTPSHPSSCHRTWFEFPDLTQFCVNMYLSCCLISKAAPDPTGAAVLYTGHAQQ